MLNDQRLQTAAVTSAAIAAAAPSASTLAGLAAPAPVALVLGAIVLQERVDAVSIIGAVVCIVGAMIIRLEPRQQTAPRAA